MNPTPLELLEHHGIRATANRLLIAKVLMCSAMPLSLLELETELETIERSSILRVLTSFAEHGIVHIFQDGRGVMKYELCRDSNHDDGGDLHPHFYCERCRRTFCFDSMTIPPVEAPDGFEITGLNYMLKGICPDCGK